MLRPTLATLVLMSASTVVAPAQDATPQQMQTETAGRAVDAGRIVLSDWDYAELYESATSVREMFGTPVYGANGEEIGDIEDLVINSDGHVVAAISEVGGFLDIGDTHVAIAWDQVTRNRDGFSIPVTEDTVDDFDIFSFADLSRAGQDVVSGVDNTPLGPRNWRASRFIGNYVRILGDSGARVNYGLVEDLLISDGSISATVVSATGAAGRGYFAYPYRPYAPGYGRAWQPDNEVVDLPYIEGDVRSLERFDYERLPDRMSDDAG